MPRAGSRKLVTSREMRASSAYDALYAALRSDGEAPPASFVTPSRVFCSTPELGSWEINRLLTNNAILRGHSVLSATA